MKQIFPILGLFFLVLFKLQAQDSLQVYHWSDLAAKAFLAQQAEDYALMKVYADAAYLKGKAVLPAGDSSLARLLYYKAYGIDYVLEDAEGALTLYEQAVDWQLASGAPAYDLAMTLMAMGDCYDVAFGAPQKAKAYYSQALESLETVREKHLVDYALLLFYCGNAEEQLGHLAKAKAFYKRALGFQKNGNQLDYSSTLNGLANLAKTEGRWLDAEDYYLESLAVDARELGKKHQNYSASLLNLADLYMRMRRMEEAEPLLLEAEKIDREVLGPKDLNYGVTLMGLARFYSTMGKWRKGKEYYQRAQAIFIANNWTVTAQYAGLLLSMSGNAEIQENYAEAISLSTQAIAIYQQIYPADHHVITSCMMRKANVLSKQGDYQKALSIYAQAEDRYRQALGPKHYYRLAALNREASMFIALGQPQKAVPVLKEALVANSSISWSMEAGADYLDQMRAHAFPANNYLEEYLASLAVWIDLLASKKGQKQQQLAIVDLALDLLEKERANTTQANNQFFFLRETASWVEKGLSLLAEEEVDQAIDLIERTKAVLLLQAQSAPALPKDWQQRKDQLEQKQANLRGAYLNAGAKQQEALLAALNQSNRELDQFRKELQSNYPDLAASYYQTATPKIKDLQAALGPKMALLDYFMGQEKLYILYLDKDKSRLISRSLKNGQLTKELNQLYKNLSHYKPRKKEEALALKTSYMQLAQTLGEELLGFLPAELEQLLILPDAELSFIPFGLLLSEQPKTDNYSDLPYYLKDLAISYNYSAALWLENKNSSKRKNNGLILGLAASYGGEAAEQRAPKAQNWRAVLQDLPAAKEEIKRLSDYYQGDFFIGESATESLFKEKARDYAVLHLAMHGLLDEQNPSLSALAFTEDNDSSENNFLQAYEIAQMELQADLVVLSACQTGQGRFERGNGTASLARAFMYAGSPALLVSLWQVNDQSTAYIMHQFYAQLAQGANKAEALQQAKLAYLKEQTEELAKHPNLWSAFILLGDEKSLLIKEKESSWNYILLALPLFLFALFVLLRKRK
ncbi:CHAT domain-containing protein [Saprospira grandis]|uniref:TPR repeat-containing protein n=1 Tax=Saprospira grandis (strain Lewin) TaxID=984262 RepID=H6L6Y1_SAPGL|nr:CHAT domain-containing tetratricopeptide repeat protein [Saprospira grandis]AFC26411.1 TPR repeat-containing protein [Saprospira grandis str. Lewin]